MLFQINPSFTKKNQLKLNLSKNLVNQNFKLCFSLVYSIQSIEGAEIVKQIGRYYELTIQNNTVLIDLQKPRIGSYNMSCGPEGTFIIDNKNKHIKFFDLKGLIQKTMQRQPEHHKQAVLLELQNSKQSLKEATT